MPGAGGQDGTHVRCPEAAMGEGPLQRREQGRPTVGPFQVGDERQLRGQPRGTGGRCLAQERLGHRTEVQEGDLGGRPRPQRPGRLLRRATIVLVMEAHLARGP